MILNCAANEGFEISPRFRQSIESRVARLERDAESDEAFVIHLADSITFAGKCGWLRCNVLKHCA